MEEMTLTLALKDGKGYEWGFYLLGGNDHIWMNITYIL